MDGITPGSEQEGSSTTFGSMERAQEEESVQSAGMESVGRVDVINHSSHMTSAQNQQEIFGCGHDQGHAPCARKAVGGGMVFSDLSTERFEQSKSCWRSQLYQTIEKLLLSINKYTKIFHII